MVDQSYRHVTICVWIGEHNKMIEHNDRRLSTQIGEHWFSNHANWGGFGWIPKSYPTFNHRYLTRPTFSPFPNFVIILFQNNWWETLWWGVLSQCSLFFFPPFLASNNFKEVFTSALVLLCLLSMSKFGEIISESVLGRYSFSRHTHLEVI